MTALPPHLRLPTSPDTDPRSVISGDRWRISILDAGLVRLQWSPSGRFEDRASQTVLHRTLHAEPPAFVTRQSDQLLEVITDRLHLVYDRGPFAPQGLSVQARGGISSYHSVWRYGMPADGNLGGTARTLDGVDGRLPLDDGILSLHGIAVLDDSETVLLQGDWLASREPGSVDVYVFCYGRDYRAALSVFHRLTGRAPLVPRFALGSWWSRYHRYTAQEYLDLMDRFAAERIPLSVAVIDMDWHPVDIDPQYGSGWTGYSWNRDLFPDPPEFLAELRRRGLKATLNVHPADGVRAHEDGYAGMAQALGHDPDAALPIAFDPTDPQFLAAYLSQVHHPLEADGVDFWWLDWQSGPISRMAGLDPLWLLNHLHFLDSGRDGGRLGRRPMTFSRYAGPGSHRYPIGFSGDTVVSWQSLAFQPEFTATASNIGYGWWSHDIGGHMFGAKDDELATRWVQLGVFSPILRLHSAADPFNSKEPWRFGEVARRVMTHYLRLRHRLLPYLATLAHHAHHDDRPLVEPMYHEYPSEEAAYAVANQFRFGPALLVAPVTTPRDPVTGRAATRVWLPDGAWVDLLTGLAYRGGRTVVMHRDIDTLPLLTRPGTVLPLLPESAANGDIDLVAQRVNDTDPPAAVELWVVAGADGAFTLVEDRDDDAWAQTDLEYRHSAGEVRIAPVRGAASSVPPVRDVTLVLIGFTRIDRVSRDGEPLGLRPGPIPGSRLVEAGSFETAAGVTVHVEGERRLAVNDVITRVFTLLDDAQVAFAAKAAIWHAVRASPPAEAALAVQALRAGDALTEAVCEILLAAP